MRGVVTTYVAGCIQGECDDVDNLVGGTVDAVVVTSAGWGAGTHGSASTAPHRPVRSSAASIKWHVSAAGRTHVRVLLFRTAPVSTVTGYALWG